MFGLIPHIGPWELIAILAVVLIIFGPANCRMWEIAG